MALTRPLCVAYVIPEGRVAGVNTCHGTLSSGAFTSRLTVLSRVTSKGQWRSISDATTLTVGRGDALDGWTWRRFGRVERLDEHERYSGRKREDAPTMALERESNAVPIMSSAYPLFRIKSSNEWYEHAPR